MKPDTKSPYKSFVEVTHREHFVRDKTFDIDHVRLDIRVDEKAGTVGGSATIELSAIAAVSEIELDAIDLQVKRVVEGGKSLRFERLAEKLRIRLGRKLKEGQKTRVKVFYSASPKKGLYFIRPDKGYPDKPYQVWSQGEQEDNRYWMPIYDSPNDKMTSEVVATVRDGLTALSNGRLLSAKHDKRAKTRTFHWMQDKPHPSYLIALVIGEFAEVKDKAGHVPLGYYVRAKDEALAAPTFKATKEVIAFFEKSIGHPYPWAKYDQVVITDFMWGGMENTTLTTVNEKYLVDEKTRADFDPDGLVAHELAHQWWGDLVTTKSWEHIWLNEGFATYFDALFYEHKHGKDEFQYHMLANAKSYMDEDSNSYRRPVVTNMFTDPEDMFDRHTYPKGAWALHMIRYALGDALFWKAINHYIKKNAGKNVETNDFKIAIEEATGRNLDWVFRQWLYKAGHPEYEVKWSWNDGVSAVVLNVKQKQTVTEDTPMFRMPVEILVETEKRTKTFKLDVEKAEQTFHLVVDSKPKLVQFDPDQWILKRLKFEKEKDELLHELANSKGIIGRITAAEGLSKVINDDKVIAALEASLTRDKFYVVRISSGRALAAIGNDLALESLLKGLKDKDPRVRRSVADSLGGFKKPPAVEALIKTIGSDKSDYVVAYALAALGKTRSERAFDVLAKNLPRKSHNDVIPSGVLSGLSELKDERAVSLIVKETAYGRPSTIRNAAISALGRLWEPLEKKRDDIMDALADTARDEMHSQRRATYEALAHVVESRAFAALDRGANTDPIGMLRHTARLSLKSLREKKEEQATHAKTQKELEEMREKMKQLELKIADVEQKVGKAGKNGARKR
ncbi:MAG: HEAT repeat domain-containing protein [Euryarchaeota archaeon]|nr:HEAT repeat domain-containing protein [Euryarchaeota archaeon]